MLEGIQNHKIFVAMGADHLATGHYARIAALPSGDRGLFKAADALHEAINDYLRRNGALASAACSSRGGPFNTGPAW